MADGDVHTVTAPDGKEISFPLSMNPDQIQGAMQKLYPPKMQMPVAPTPQVDMKFALTPRSVLGAVTHDPAYAPGSMSPLQALGAVGTGAAIGSTAGGVYAAPAATAMGLGGAYAGGKVGREVGGWVGHPEIGSAIGGLAGGFAGPAAMSRFTGQGGALGGLIRALRGETAEAGAAGMSVERPAMQGFAPKTSTAQPSNVKFVSKFEAPPQESEQVAKLDKMISEAETARQKEIAQMERLREQHAQSLVRRQQAEDKIVKATTAKNAFTVERPNVTQAGIPQTQAAQPSGVQFVKQFEKPGPSKIVSPGSEPPPVARTLVSWERPDLVSLVRNPNTPYQTRVLAIRELRRSPGNVPSDLINSLEKYMVEGGARTKIYGGPTK